MNKFLTTFCWALLGALVFIFGLECIVNVPADIERIQYTEDIKIAVHIALVIAIFFGINYRETLRKIIKH